MALAETITGDGKLVDQSQVARIYHVFEPGEGEGLSTAKRFVEIVESEVREWVALTKQCAKDAQTGAIQPDDGGAYTYQAQEVDRITLAYRLIRTYEKKTTYEVPLEPTQAATPTFAPASGEQTNPVSVTVSCATANATLRYTLDGEDPDWTSAVATPGDVIEVSSPGTIKAIAFAVGYLSSDIGSASYTLPG